MDTLIERCAGLDIHRDTVVACVRVPGEGRRREQEVRSFSTTTGGLLRLLDWLASYRVTLVGMESTGSYLEASLIPARGALRVLALECPASAQRPRPQDRCR